MTDVESTGTGSASEANLSDKDIQRRIASGLRNYVHINLKIPAQRQVADEVRSELGIVPNIPDQD